MKSNRTEHPLRVGLISLGCAKNLVDAEIMLGSLLKDGVEIINDAAQADVLIVNTCSFIDAAQEESVDAILESAELREAKNRGQGLVVSGCLPQRFREQLPKLLPEVDAFMGIDQVAQVTEIVRQALQRRRERVNERIPKARRQKRTSEVLDRFDELERQRPDSPEERNGKEDSKGEEFPLVEVHRRPTYIPDFATPRFRLTPRHFAYLKIAEGCNHPCSFCTIPRMRGAHRSRPQHDILEEARRLLAEGVKELNLISQDSTYYGLDLRKNHRPNIASPEKFSRAAHCASGDGTTLSTLLRELNALPGDFWIRLLYTHPAHWTDELIKTLAECPKVARYVDIPLQHIHPNMLERMRRETSKEYIVDLLAKIRAGIPGIALRTTFIVGFPGETAGSFEALLDFMRAVKFERAGVFIYSREEGTRAGQMAGQVPEKTKKQRRNAAMATQREISSQICKSQVGRRVKVLVERQASARDLARAKIASWEHGLMRGSEARTSDPRLGTGSALIARSEADAPDIDGRVFVRGQLPVGAFARVRIVGHTDYDLLAEPAN